MSVRSSAVQIVRPPVVAKAAEGVDGKEKGKRDGTQRLCRNVLIYGSAISRARKPRRQADYPARSCKYQDQGPGVDPTQTTPPKKLSPSLPPSTPATESKSTSSSGIGLLGAGHLSAPVFVPKAPMDTSPRPSSPIVNVQPPAPQWPSLAQSGGLLGTELNGGALQQQASLFILLLMSGFPDYLELQITYDESLLGLEHQHGLDAKMYISQQNVRHPLDHHLYTAPLPHLTNTGAHPLHSFFIPDDLRRFIHARQEATIAGTGTATGLPAEVHVYHSLMPVGGEGTVVPPSRVFHHPAHVYRAVSSVDGNVYCLRRIEGFKLVNEQAFGAIETWRRMKHPNIVSLREAFTTKAFNDNSLILVYDFHPDSTTTWEEHMTTEAPKPMGRRRVLVPIPERLLWSYITQVANALKAIHSSNLSARNLDPTKLLITGKNRIRLNGCGILDVLAYDATTPISAYQQDDLVSFGKLIISLCCEHFAGQHPGTPLEYIGRTYSPDVQNLVLFLISKPSPMKTVDDVISMLGARILNDFDAMQNYADSLESELQSEVENGRLVRLMAKLGFINERAEFELDSRWSDTGDRYIVKLFRDYVFHSIGADGTPVLDLSHVLTCLNKLDAGLDERIMLVSRDDQSCLVVSYREIKNCIEAAFK
ncbi:PAB-dependent poly(A)-specific ribonuclease subunit 3, partial [Tremellales sp. Uapishka_1]